MASIIINTDLFTSEASWIAYNSGVQAFLRLRNTPIMRSSESINDALRRATPTFIGCTETSVQFTDRGIAEQFMGCIKRSLYTYSPSLADAVVVE